MPLSFSDKCVLVFPKWVYNKLWVYKRDTFYRERGNGFRLKLGRFKLAIRKRFKAVSGQRVLGHQLLL